MSGKIIEEAEALLEKFKDTVPGPIITVQNIMDQYRHLFSDTTLALMDKPQAKSLVQQVPGTMDYEKVILFSFMCKEDKIPSAAKKLADIVNHHAAEGHIVNFLSPLCTLQLNILLTGPTEYAVYCWPNMTSTGDKAVQAAKYDFVYEEGSVPMTLLEE